MEKIFLEVLRRETVDGIVDAFNVLNAVVRRLCDASSPPLAAVMVVDSVLLFTVVYTVVVTSGGGGSSGEEELQLIN